MKRLVITTLTGVVLSACTQTPVRLRELDAVPAQFAEVGAWSEARPADDAPKGAWWTRFEDTQLNTLQATLNDSPSVKILLARLEQARASARIAAGAEWPKLSVGATASRTQTSTLAPNYSPARPDTYNDFNAAGLLSYEVDLFGRVHAQATGARAQAAAAAGDAASLELALRAELTTTYFQLRALDAQLDVLERTVDALSRAYAMTERLHQGGAVAVSDVSQARSQWETAKSQQADTRLRRAQTEHALATLLGHAASQWHLAPSPLPDHVTLPQVAPGIPAQLLQRRPDIAAAERRVASASAAVGVAERAYFPVFTLNAALGRDSTQTNPWFTAPARYWSLAPTAVATLLDGGQRRGQIRLTKAALAESTEMYRRTVFTAYQEVEDSLAAIRELDTAQMSADANWTATQTTQDQAIHRYEAGATSYLEVAAAQNAALAARINVITIQQRRIAATTQLVRALGGDWR